jgi:diguanylate cyclase (GGDEF)-like protein
MSFVVNRGGTFQVDAYVMNGQPGQAPSRSRRSGERHRLHALYDVTRRLAGVHETDTLLALIVTEAARLIGAEASGLRLLEGDDLVLRARTASAAALLSRERLKVGESLSGLVVAKGEPVAVEDLVEDTHYDPAHKRGAMALGFHGFLGVPLRANDVIIGVLNVYTKRQRTFPPDEVAVLSAFADQASLAIEKDRLVRDAQARAIRLRALARLNQLVSASLNTREVLGAIAGAAADLMAVPAVVLWTVDEARETLEVRAFSDERLAADYPVTTLSFGQGVAGWVAKHRCALDVPDLFSDPRGLTADWLRAHELSSAIALPIVLHDRLLGVLGFFGRTPFRRAPDTQDLLETFVAQAAAAIRNARLYEELRVAHEQLERRTRGLDLLTHTAEVLQACVSQEEAFGIVERFGKQCFPEEGGAVFITSASRNLVEVRAAWGSFSAVAWGVFKPEDCWALRRGRAHLVTDTETGLLCQHLPRPLPAASLCVPLMAQGDALGVLYLSAPAGSGPARLGEEKQRLAQTVAEQFGLTLANLKLREALRNQSIRDPLTGLFNRRYMEETLERELRRVARSEHSLGVVMLDLDHFKTFNDTFGHEAGDALLRAFGELLRLKVRGEDVACRYGGEEFVLILPDMSAELVARRADELREAIKRLQVSHRSQSLGGVTLSAGVAVYPGHGENGESLVRAADMAMYRAKNAGRDRVIVAE